MVVRLSDVSAKTGKKMGSYKSPITYLYLFTVYFWTKTQIPVGCYKYFPSTLLSSYSNSIFGKSYLFSTEVGKNNDRLIKKVVEKLKRGLQFLWKDLTKKHLLWVKIIFFLQSASLVTLYPYLVRNTFSK